MRLKEYPFHCVDIDCCAGNLSPLQWAVNQNWLPFRLFEIEGFERFARSDLIALQGIVDTAPKPSSSSAGEKTKCLRHFAICNTSVLQACSR